LRGLSTKKVNIKFQKKMHKDRKDELSLPAGQAVVATNDAQGFAAGNKSPQNSQNDSIFGFLTDICSLIPKPHLSIYVKGAT